MLPAMPKAVLLNYKIERDMNMNCPNCNHPLEEKDVFCKVCGTPVSPEKRAFSTLPLTPAAKPLTTGNYFVMLLIQIIPVLNIIMLLIWAFSKKSNLNRKHYARAILLWWLIGIAIIAVVTITLIILEIPLFPLFP